jgi:4-hydroxy-4-methyl-2-oxoglutarate aldolase
MMPNPTSNTSDPYEIRKLYEYLRVVDVVDAMDGIGYFNIGLMDREIQPLWRPMKFWGVALTLRCVPANRPMWKLDNTEDIVNAHGIWFREVGNIGINEHIQEGSVVVTDTGGSGEVGYWGSNNSLDVVARGAVGIITDGYTRDTAELTLQKTPVVTRRRGRPIIPGRIMAIETQVTIGCGGAQVRPGDIVGCDDDGVVVVPIEVAEEVAVHARAVLLADMRGRRRLYERLGMEPDETVDVEMVEQYYSQFA